MFDAAAGFNGVSLNDQLYQGPDLANSLIGVLIRFREEEIAFTAELEAMFHQVKVLPKDADALRFLWWSGSLNDPSHEYQMLVHILAPRRHLAAQTRQCIKQQMTMRTNLTQR